MTETKPTTPARFGVTLAVLLLASALAPTGAASLPPPPEIKPDNGGCDVLGLTCAGSAAIAQQLCIDIQATGSANANGNFLWIIPVSGSGEVTVPIKGCISFAVAVGVGLSNNFPSEVHFTMNARVGNDYESLPIEESACVTPVGLAQYCASGVVAAFASMDPICGFARAQVSVNGAQAYVAAPPASPVQGAVGFAYSRAQASLPDDCSVRREAPKSCAPPRCIVPDQLDFALQTAVLDQLRTEAFNSIDGLELHYDAGDQMAKLLKDHLKLKLADALTLNAMTFVLLE